MKALVYHGPGKRAWEDKPKPSLQDASDASVKIVRTTICGTDLHIMKGDVPAVTDGRALGHEGVGIIDEVGSAVSNFERGDRVLISCTTSCGSASLITHEFELQDLMNAYATFSDAASQKALEVIIRS